MTESFEEPIRLDQFLKIWGVVSTGGEAKIVIQEGRVLVNGVVETRRGKKLAVGDVVEFEQQVKSVEWGNWNESETPE